MLSANKEEWTVEVDVPLPHCPSAQAAYEKLASPTKWKEWRSSEFVKIKCQAGKGVSEPVKTNDEWFFYPFIFTFTNKAIEAEATDDTAVMDAVGRGLFGLMHARLRFDVYKNDKGEWMGKAREKHMRGRWMFPKDDVIRGEHRTMFQELDKLFEEEAK